VRPWQPQPGQVAAPGSGELADSVQNMTRLTSARAAKALAARTAAGTEAIMGDCRGTEEERPAGEPVSGQPSVRPVRHRQQEAPRVLRAVRNWRNS